MKRLFDLSLSLILLVLLFPLLVILSLLCLLAETKATPLYWSKRVGKNNALFLMPKFRTMRLETPQMATHLLSNPDQFLTPIGKFLRKTSFDELPQLWSILKGDMSFVGPRPALYNQEDLIQLRTKKGIEALVPGLTGWAQVNGRDDLPIPIKVNFDFEYLKKKSFFFDLKILLMTFLKVLKSEGVKH